MFFSASASTAVKVSVNGPAVEVADESEPEVEPDLVPTPYRPRFAELAEEPIYKPLPRDYASDFTSGLRGPSAPAYEEQRVPAASLFSDAGEETHRDLDVPAFMRRSQF